MVDKITIRKTHKGAPIVQAVTLAFQAMTEETKTRIKLYVWNNEGECAESCLREEGALVVKRVTLI